jgi:hypothetical protein
MDDRADRQGGNNSHFTVATNLLTVSYKRAGARPLTKIVAEVAPYIVTIAPEAFPKQAPALENGDPGETFGLSIVSIPSQLNPALGRKI